MISFLSLKKTCVSFLPKITTLYTICVAHFIFVKSLGMRNVPALSCRLNRVCATQGEDSAVCSSQHSVN
jgi:hypothetical protein